MRYKRKKEKNMAVLAIQSPIVIMNNELENLKQRAMLRKQRLDLRHTPSEHDIFIANENVKVLSLSQYKTIK
jgi:hypothetical protein